MAIFDGLKNGYPSYFMYQPAQGLNPQLLAYSMRGRSSSTGRSGSSSSTTKKKYEDPDGPYAQLQDYTEVETTLNQQESALRQNYASWLIQNDFDMQSSDGQAKQSEFTQGMVHVEQARSKQSMNRSLMEQNLDTYKSVDSSLESKNLTGHAFVGVPSASFMQEYGLPRLNSITGSQSSVIAYKYKDGKRVPVTPFYQGEDGEVHFNEEARGFFTDSEMMRFQKETVGLNKEGLADAPFVPSFYEPGRLQATLQSLVKDAKEGGTEYITAADFNPETGTYSSVRGGETDMTMEIGNNFDNLKSFLNTAVTNTADQNLMNEAQSNWANDIMAGREIYVPSGDGKTLVPKDVSKVTLQEYITARAAGLVNMNRKSTANLSKRPGSEDEEDFETFPYNYNDIIGQPDILKDVGSSGVSGFFNIGGTDLPENFTKEAGKNYNIWTAPMSTKATADRNRDIIGSVNPMGVQGGATSFDVRDHFQFSRGLITADGTILYPGDAANPVWFQRVTGKVTYMPKYQEDPISGQELTYALNDTGVGVEYAAAEEMSVVMKGSDMREHLNLISVDEDATEDAIKDELKKQQAGRQLPDEVTRLTNRYTQLQKKALRYAAQNSTAYGADTMFEDELTEARAKLEKAVRQHGIEDFNWDTYTAPLLDEDIKIQTDQILTAELEKKAYQRYGQLRRVEIDGDGNIKKTSDNQGRIKNNKYYQFTVKYYPSETQNLSISESKSNTAKTYNRLNQIGRQFFVPRAEAEEGGSFSSPMRNAINEVNKQ